MKICTKCRLNKSLEEFVPDGRLKSGVGSRCKTCVYEVNRFRYLNDENFRARVNRSNENSALQRRYGITIEDRDSLLALQNNKCAICKIDFEASNKNKNGNIDHNHSTSKVRGILCANCNAGLGMFQDNIDILISAVNYLRDTNG